MSAPYPNCPYPLDIVSMLSYCWELSFSLGTDAVCKEALFYSTSQRLNKEDDPINKMSQFRKTVVSGRIFDTVLL